MLWPWTIPLIVWDCHVNLQDNGFQDFYNVHQSIWTVDAYDLSVHFFHGAAIFLFEFLPCFMVLITLWYYFCAIDVYMLHLCFATELINCYRAAD